MNESDIKKFKFACGEDCMLNAEHLAEKGASEEELIDAAISDTCLSSVIYLAVRTRLPSIGVAVMKYVSKEDLEFIGARDLGEISNLIFEHGNVDEKESFASQAKSLTPLLALRFLHGTKEELMTIPIRGTLATIIYEKGAEEIKNLACDLHVREEITLPYNIFNALRNNEAAVA